MKDIKAIIEGIVSQGKFVGSRGHAFRASSSSDSSGGKHDHGIDIGARRNLAHQMATRQRVDQNTKNREQETQKRNKEAEQRRKETSKMAKEETVTEAKHVFHVHMKADDTRSHKMIDDKTSEPIGNKPKGQKLVLKVPAVDSREARNKVSKHISKNYGVHAVKSIEYKGLDEETIEEGVFAKHETDHLKQMHARDVGTISRYKGKMGAGIDDVIDREHDIRKELTKRGHQVEKPKHKLVIEAEVSRGTEARVKVKNVARPEDAAPTSEKSVLDKQGQIKTKIIDEEKPTMSMPNFGLPKSLIDSVRQIVEKKQDDDGDQKKMTGGKTEVDLDPETNDNMDDDDAKKKSKSKKDDKDDDDDKKSVKEGKEHTVPKSDKEKKLAALAHPKDKITHKDVLVGRGVVKEEEVEQIDEVSKKTLGSYIKKASKDAVDKTERAGEMFSSGSVKHAFDIDGKARKRLVGVDKATDRLTKEEVEQIDEVNHREYGAKGKMHPDMAKGMKVGQHADFYTSGTGDKSYGKVTKNDGRAVHVNVKGKVHKFSVTPHLGEDVTFSDEEKARIEEIAKSFPAEIDEAVKKSSVPSATTATSSPTRGANQDQSGYGTKSSTADYTISDNAKFSNMHGDLTTKKVKPKMAKEEVEIEESLKDWSDKHEKMGHKITKDNKNATYHAWDKNNKHQGAYKATHKIDEAKLPSMTIQVTKPSFGKQKIHNLAHDVDAKHPDTGHDLSPGDNVTPEHLKKLKNQGHSIEVVNEQVNIEEGRGRPRKNPLPPGQESEGDDTNKHPMQQLEKISHAFEGKEPHFEHKDGSKSKVSRHLARHIVAIHNSMKTTQEKDNFAQKVHANRDSMKAEVGKHL